MADRWKVPVIGIADAREKARALKLAQRGIDPRPHER